MLPTNKSLFDQILDVICSRNITTFFLNGPPGSGKTQYLKDLREKLPRSKVSIQPFGPYLVDWTNLSHLPHQIISEFREAGYLNSDPGGNLEFSEIFTWLTTKLPTSFRDFVILVDLGKTNIVSIREVAVLFSSARRLEGQLSSSQVKLHFIFGGFWNLYRLDQFYRERNVSFPYTIGYNFAFYQGLTEEAITQFVSELRYANYLPLHSKIIHELTDGHPSICHEILNNIPDNELSLRKILQVTDRIAKAGVAGNLFLDSWLELPNEAKRFIGDLIIKRHITAQIVPELRNQLVASGLVKEATHGSSKYLTFRSWYIELLLRYRGTEIGISVPDKLVSSIPEMMPEVGAVNRIAYEVIHDIENQLRNFITIQANLNQKDRQHYLNFQVNYRSNLVDLAKLSTNQKLQNLKALASSDINPLIAFSYTRHLADVVNTLADEIGSVSWKKIAHSVHLIADIRNAVMHNQLISEEDLAQLTSLQNDIYKALNS